jgi:UDP-N-acetylglucosamine pyrophosphorylase
LKNRDFDKETPQNFCLHSRLGHRQWSLAPDKNSEEFLCQNPDSSSCLCIHDQKEAQIWKCERFIFDLLDYARASAVLVYPREKIYAPLKNASGEKSVETVKEALLCHYRQVYQALTGCVPLVSTFELDPAFYYPSEELKKRLREHSLRDQEYVAATRL